MTSMPCKSQCLHLHGPISIPMVDSQPCLRSPTTQFRRENLVSAYRGTAEVFLGVNRDALPSEGWPSPKRLGRSEMRHTVSSGEVGLIPRTSHLTTQVTVSTAAEACFPPSLPCRHKDVTNTDLQVRSRPRQRYPQGEAAAETTRDFRPSIVFNKAPCADPCSRNPCSLSSDVLTPTVYQSPDITASVWHLVHPGQC